MSTTKDGSGQDEVGPSFEDIAEVEAALVEWGDAIRGGAKFRIISLAHDESTTVPSDILLEIPHGLEVVEVFDALISDSEARESYYQSMLGESNRKGRRKLSYVERRLILLANRYLAVMEYLEEKHGIDVSGDEYSKWKDKLLDQSNAYMEASTYGLTASAQSKALGPARKIDDSLNIPDLPILAAVAVLETIVYISKIIDMSVREMVAPLTLDSALQLSNAFAFCESSYALLNIEDIKERGWREIQAKYRRDAATFVRSAIKKKLVELFDCPDKERFRYKEGKRRGRLKIDYIVGRVQKKFESDNAWQKKIPGTSVLREEIRNFDNT